METVRENVCCRSYGQIRTMLKARNAYCISDLQIFRDNCLNSGVLETSRHDYIHQHGPFGDEHQLNEFVYVLHVV